MIRTRTAVVSLLVLFVIPVIVNLLTEQSAIGVLVTMALQVIEVPIWLLIGVALLVVTAANDALYRYRVFVESSFAQHARETAELQAEMHLREQKIVTLTNHLDDARQLRFLDVVTGISNEAKWKDDVREAARVSSADNPIQVALVDLVGFGRLNDELGYQKVDEILRYLAKSLDASLRKNEGLYKRPLADEALLPDRLYRKYPGGDEFYVIAKGSEADMLGLLTRLQDLLSKQIDKHVSTEIAFCKVELRFAGAVCRLHRNEEPDAVMGRLIDHIRRTRYPNANRRLVWESGRTSADVVADPREFGLYSRAEETFGQTP